MQRIVTYTGPIFLLLMFALQLYLVETYDLSRWKGAGMGMFSSIDERRMHVTVSGNDVPLQHITSPVRMNMPRTLSRYTYLPTHTHREAIILELATYNYFIDTNGVVHVGRLFNSQNIGRGSYSEAQAHNQQLRSFYRHAPASTLSFDTFVIKVHDFDRKTGRLSALILDH